MLLLGPQAGQQGQGWLRQGVQGLQVQARLQERGGAQVGKEQVGIKLVVLSS